METPQGPVNVCAACMEEIKKRERRKKIIGFLLSPFTSPEDL
jgi:hypothetical protein